MGAPTVLLFLSYADEDGRDGREIGDWFRNEGFGVYDWEDPRQRGGRFIEEIEDAISKADAFLVLLSRDSLASPWCRLEREFAMVRDIDLHGRSPTFIHVLKIADTPFSGAGFLRTWDWVDLTSPATRHNVLRALADRLRLARPVALQRGHGAPLFRNRHDELEKVLRGLTNAGGPHFWLVNAPPQLGKTWFLNRLSAQLMTDESSPWVARLVDVREQPADVRGDAAALLASLFGLSARTAIESDTLVSIAQEISRKGMSYLCLLDSAELLTEDTATTLRSCLGQIYDLVQRLATVDVRLGLIVASRRDDEWRGVTPHPRLSVLPLTEFKVDVVQQALRDLADQMGRITTPPQLRQNRRARSPPERRAARAARAVPAVDTAGAMVQTWSAWKARSCLRSSRSLTSRKGCYRMTASSGGTRGEPGEARRALEQAFRILAPYRLFTQVPPAPSSRIGSRLPESSGLSRMVHGGSLDSHQRHRPAETAAERALAGDPRGRSAGSFIATTTSPTSSAPTAHREARGFVEVWADGQSGKEQVIGLVECLWHEAAVAPSHAGTRRWRRR